MYRSTYPNPSPHTRIHTHKQTATINKAIHINTNHQTINRATHSDQQRPHTLSHTQTSWSQQRPPDPPPTPPVRNPRRRFETQAIENTQKIYRSTQKIPKKTHDTPKIPRKTPRNAQKNADLTPDTPINIENTQKNVPPCQSTMPENTQKIPTAHHARKYPENTHGPPCQSTT